MVVFFWNFWVFFWHTVFVFSLFRFLLVVPLYPPAIKANHGVGGCQVATVALTVPMFLSYNSHAAFQCIKIAASIWNGGWDSLPTVSFQQGLI